MDGALMGRLHRHVRGATVLARAAPVGRAVATLAKVAGRAHGQRRRRAAPIGSAHPRRALSDVAGLAFDVGLARPALALLAAHPRAMVAPREGRRGSRDAPPKLAHRGGAAVGGEGRALSVTRARPRRRRAIRVAARVERADVQQGAHGVRMVRATHPRAGLVGDARQTVRAPLGGAREHRWWSIGWIAPATAEECPEQGNEQNGNRVHRGTSGATCSALPMVSRGRPS